MSLFNIFKTHSPLTDNHLAKAFKNKHSDLKITTVKQYMGAIFFEKTKSHKDENLKN